MFKRVLLTAAAVILLSTTVFAAGEVLVDGVLPEGVLVEAVPVEAVPAEGFLAEEFTVVGPTFTRTNLMPWIGHGQRTFDNVLDQVYFNLFGYGFELIQDHSIDINRSMTYGNWQLDILSAIAIASYSGSRTIWPDYITIGTNEETGDWAMINIDTREIVTEEDIAAFNTVELVNANVYTLFSLQNTSGRVNLSNAVEIVLAVDNPIDAWSMGGFGHARPLYFDEDSQILYLVMVNMLFGEEIGDNIAVDFAIERILADQEHFSHEIGMDLVYLLENHQAAFIIENAAEDVMEDLGTRLYAVPGFRHFDLEGGIYRPIRPVPRRSGLTSMEMYEILGPDFDPFAFDAEIMARGELNISIAEGIYLNNIAVRDNLLLLQISYPFDQRLGPIERWAGLSIIDTRIESIDTEELFADFEDEDWVAVMTDASIMAAFEERLELWRARYLHPIYGIDVSPMDEYFQIIGGRRYVEYAYFLEDMESLGYLSFVVTGMYYNVNAPVNFNVTGINVPLLGNESTFLETSARVSIYGRTYTIRDFYISTREISFAIEDAQPLFDAMDDNDGIIRWFNFADHVQIELIHEDGTVRDYNASIHGMSRQWSDNDQGGYARISFSGSVLDIGNLAAIKINGVQVDLR